MAKQVIRRQGSSQEHASFTGAEGEWTHDNTLNTGRFHDGVLSGGYPALLSNKINEISVSTNLDGSNFGEMIIADSTSSSFTITLPDPSVVGSGWQVAIKKSVDANSVTVSPFGGEGIDGDASVILENAENAVQVRTDGTSWYALRLNNFDDAQEILYDNSTSGLSATTVQGAIDEVVFDSNDFATLDGGNTFNGNQTLNDNLSVNGDVAFQSYSFPSADGSAGQALVTDGAGNLSFSDVGGDKISEGNSSVEAVDSGTGSIQFTVDGSEVARFTDDGRLGIGTTSPTRALEVNSGVDDDLIGFFSGAPGSYIALGVIGSDAIIKGGSSGAGERNLSFEVANSSGTESEQMRLENDGELKFNSGYGSVATAYGCRAWVNFNGTGTVAIRESGNVSSITDNGTGKYTVNFATAMPDANYSTVCGAANSVNGFPRLIGAGTVENSTYSTTAVGLYAIRHDTTNPNDIELTQVAIFR